MTFPTNCEAPTKRYQPETQDKTNEYPYTKHIISYGEDKLYVALLEKPGSVSIPRKNIVFEDMTRTLHTRYRYNWTFTIGSQIKPTHDEMKVYAVEYHPDIWTQSSIVDLTERHSSIRLTPRCAHIVLGKIANVMKRSRLIDILCGRSAVLLSYAVSFTGPTAYPTAVTVAFGSG